MKDIAIDSVTRSAVQNLCQELNTPFSQRLHMLLHGSANGESYDLQVSALVIQPADYLNASDFRKDYLLRNLLRKWIGLNTSVDARAAALHSWKLSELKCQNTNKFFRSSDMSEQSDLGHVLWHAQRIISEVLGSFSSIKCFRKCLWGQGATFDLRRRDGLDAKLSKVITVTLPCLEYGRAMLSSDIAWFKSLTGLDVCGVFSALDNCFEIVRGNMFDTVPKDAVIDRCIAKEPTMNGFLQSGVGRFIRGRLLHFGVDLSDQGVNKALAALAAKFGHLATLDLSAASDSIARELVFHLFEREWALFLDKLRSHETFVDGAWIRLDKFSSMGNGFTFELESLIFWALAKATARVERSSDSLVSVYGDDIVVDRYLAPYLVKTLEGCGFDINMSKSYDSGMFYESCGGHYFGDEDVTPAYQKRLVNSREELIKFHNRLQRWAFRAGSSVNISGTLKLLRRRYEWSYQEKIPAIPFGAHGDDGFLMPLSYFRKFSKNYGFLCRVYRFRSDLRKARNAALYALKLSRSEYQFPDVIDEKSERRKTGLALKTGTYNYDEAWFNYHVLTELLPVDPKVVIDVSEALLLTFH